MIFDTFFDDGGNKPGWGHSSWREAAEWAKLALFHYDYHLSDHDIDVIEQKAKAVFPAAFAAADHMRVEIPLISPDSNLQNSR